MKSTFKTLAVAALWLAGGAFMIAPFALAMILLASGEAGLGFVVLGLGLIQVMVMVVLAKRPRSKAQRERPGLSAAE